MKCANFARIKGHNPIDSPYGGKIPATKTTNSAVRRGENCQPENVVKNEDAPQTAGSRRGVCLGTAVVVVVGKIDTCFTWWSEVGGCGCCDCGWEGNWRQNKADSNTETVIGKMLWDVGWLLFGES